MMLLEHHAKELLATRGLPVPRGALLRRGDALPDIDAGVVKAQVPVGGRGKAGGIRLARDRDRLRAETDEVLGMRIRGHEVQAVRIERLVDFVAEAYLSFTLDAGAGRVAVMMSPHGGIEVEDEATREDLAQEQVALDPAAMVAAVERLSASMPEALRAPLCAAGLGLVPAFFEHEALLLEINPLFVRADGSWVIGDTKLAIDENALARQPHLTALIADNADLYPEAALKLDQGFDYVELDRGGDIGLITTGAGQIGRAHV